MKKWLGFLVLIVFLASILWFSFESEKSEEINSGATLQGQEEFKGFHYAAYGEKEDYGDLEKLSISEKSGEKIYGGIVSHHFFVAKEIAGFFSAFKKNPPKVVVILGPNHFDVGKADILISEYPYETPWGNLYPETNYIDKLLNAEVAFNDERPFEKEHSISTLVGFLKYYAPETKIVPIILKKNVAREKIDVLAKELNAILPEESVVVASVDFSHHLNKSAAEFHDKQSISTIENFDGERIFSSEIDSPASVYTLEKYLDSRGARKLEYKSTNAAVVSGNDYLEDVTSYLFAHFSQGNPKKNKDISILSFGDMMLGRDVDKILKNNIDPLEKIKGIEGNFLKGVDFITANLEGPITENTDCVQKAYSFKFLPQTGKLIHENGFNVLNLANNHTFDCKEKGLKDTKNYLTQNKITYFGEPTPEKSYVIKEVNNQKVAFVGLDLTSRSNDMAKYYALISQLKKENERVIINIHWGLEYQPNPSEVQKEVAHALIDSGADLIIGHHPHVIQPMEIYKNKAIFYSLGNFIFDQVGEKMNKGVGVGAVFNGESVTYVLFPYKIKSYQPALLSPQQAEIFCDNYLNNIQNHNECEFELKFDQ